MRYPIVNLPEARTFLTDRREGRVATLPEIGFAGSGDSVPDSVINDFVAQIHEHKALAKTLGKKAGVAQFEANAAETVYRFAQQLSPEVVMDCRFWCYLSLHQLLDVITWRHPGTEKTPAALSNFAADRTQFRESLLVRLYLRGALGVQTPSPDSDVAAFDLVGIGGQDVWRSHIFRVKIGNAPSLVHSLLRLIDAKELDVQVVRKLAKRLTQLRSNVLFETLTAEQADSAMSAAHSHSSS